MKENISVLIAAQPGPLRDALQAMLTMMPQIETINQVDDALSVLRVNAEHHPALVLLDVNLSGNEASTVVREIKGSDSPSRCLVLADNVQQQQEAQAAGADVALLKGFPAAKLFETIKELLTGQEVF